MEPWGRGKKRKQMDRSWDEQPDPSGNEQENPQGGGRSSVMVSIAFLILPRSGWWLTVIITQSTLQRVNINTEPGAPQTFSDGRSGPTANSRNPIARNNSGDRTTANSHTADNRRTYIDAENNEFNDSIFNGPVTIHHPSQSSASTGNRTHADMKNLGR